MLWSEICMTIGMPTNMSLGQQVPMGMVVPSFVFENFFDSYEILEEYDPKPTLLNTAFYLSDDEEELDEEYECILENEYERMMDEDYDW